MKVIPMLASVEDNKLFEACMEELDMNYLVIRQPIDKGYQFEIYEIMHGPTSYTEAKDIVGALKTVYARSKVYVAHVSDKEKPYER